MTDSDPVLRRGMRVRVHAATDVGKSREHNEDSYHVGHTIFAVADGMGGHAAGEVASREALPAIADLDGEHYRTSEDADDALADAVRQANRTVIDQSTADSRLAGMGTTLTAAMVRDGRLHIAHVGDSRAYLLRRGEPLRQLTTDHTLVEQLVREGRIRPEEVHTHPQRSVVTRAIGIESTVEVDVLAPIELLPGDQVLICSDGLSGPVDDNRISALLQDHADGDAAVAALIAAANAAGGPDNITAVLLRVEGGDLPSTLIDTEAATADLDTSELDLDEADVARWSTSSAELDQSETKRRRWPWAVAAALLVVGLVGGAGVYLLSQAYFLGVRDGNVAIFTGVPYEFAGLSLARMVEESDLAMADLPERRQNSYRRGITAASLEDARAIIERDSAALATPSDPEPPSGSTDTDDTDTDDTGTGTDDTTGPSGGATGSASGDADADTGTGGTGTGGTGGTDTGTDSSDDTDTDTGTGATDTGPTS